SPTVEVRNRYSSWPWGQFSRPSLAKPPALGNRAGTIATIRTIGGKDSSTHGALRSMMVVITTGKRAVGLARISNEEKRKERKGTVGHSIETQASLIYSTAESLGLAVVQGLGVTYIVGVPT